MLSKFKNRIVNESGAAAVYAIALMIAILAFTLIATQTMLTSVTVTRTVSQQSHYQSAADTGIANALWVANNDAAHFTLATATNPQTGNIDDQTKWSWYSELVDTADASKGYKVTAKGYANAANLNSSASVTVTAKLIPRHVYKATCANSCDKITYYPIEGGYFEHGIYSGGALTLGTNTVFKSFSSSASTTLPTTTTVSTNNVIVSAAANISGNATNFASILKLNTYDNTTCPIVNTKSLCDMVITEKHSYNLEGSNGMLNMKNLCTSPNAWVASANGGVLNLPSGGVCYSSMLFDTNTTIISSASVSNPLRIVVQGDVTVNAGVSVNKTGSPKKLKLFIGGTATLKGGAEDYRTYFSGELAANAVSLSTSRYGTYYGTIWSNTTLNILWDKIWFDTDSVYQTNTLIPYNKTQYVLSAYKITESIRDASLTGGGN